MQSTDLALMRQAGIPLGALETTTTTWRRAPRGRIHSRCGHYSPKNPEQVELTFIQLDDVDRCRRDMCWYRTGFSPLFGLYAKRANQLAQVWSDCSKLDVTFDWGFYVTIRNLLADIDATLERYDRPAFSADGLELSALESYSQSLRERLEALEARASESVTDRRSVLRGDLVLELPQPTGPDDLFGPDGRTYAYRVLGEMFVTWQEAVSHGETPDEARTQALDVFGYWTDALRLRGAFDGEIEAPGPCSLNHARVLNQRLNSIVDEWDSELETLVSNTLERGFQLLAFPNPNLLLDATSRSAVARYGGVSDATTVVALPDRLAARLYHLQDADNAGEVLLGLRGERDDDQVLRAFVTLWVPSETGALSNPHAALDAARTVVTGTTSV